MLRSLRGLTSNSILRVGGAIILIASFALWGAADWLTPGRDASAVARVSGAYITLDHLARAYRRDSAVLAQQGLVLTPQEAEEQGLARITLRRMIDQRLLADEARRLQLEPSDAMLRREIESTRVFQDAEGRFSRARYVALLRQQGDTEASYQHVLHEDMQRALLRQALGALMVEPYALAVRHLRHTRDTLHLRSLILDEVESVAEPSAEALREHYEERRDDFLDSERRDVTYIAVEAEDMAVEVSEAEVQEAYGQRRDVYTTATSASLWQILFPTRGAAMEAAGAMASLPGDVKGQKRWASERGGIFAALGRVREGDLPTRESNDRVFSQDEGVWTGPVEMALGWALVRVADRRASRVRKLEEVREELAGDLEAERALEMIYDLSFEADNLLATGAGLEELAAALTLPLRSAQGVNTAGELVDGEKAQLPQGRQFLEAVFEADPEAPDPVVIETDSGGFFVVRVDAVTTPEIPAFDTIEKRVRQHWQQQARTRATMEEAQGLLSRLEAGESMEELAQDPAFKARLRHADLGSVNREGLERTLSIPSTVFGIDERFWGPAEHPLGAIILERGAYKSYPIDPEVVRQFQRTHSHEAQLLEGYLQELRARAEIIVYEDRLRQVY